MENNENDLELLRNHIRICINEIMHKTSKRRISENDFAIRIKSWGLTLFVASLAFCVKEQQSIENLYYFLPFIPVLFFWFLYAYQTFIIERYSSSVKDRGLNETLARLYDYTYEELKNILIDIPYELSWKDKGKFKPIRFISKKFPKILKLAFSASNVMFFGLMIFIWVLFLILN